MSLWLHVLKRRARSLFRRRQLDTELSDEMQGHLELQIAENLRAGMTPEDARYAALRTFGGVEQVKERCRDTWGWIWLEHVGRDLRFAVRSLRRAPAFSLAVLATLALCIGPNTAIMSILYTVVLKPLPFPEADRIVLVYNVSERNGSRLRTSVHQYLDYGAHADRLDHLSLLSGVNLTLEEESEPFRAQGQRVTVDFFRALNVPMLLGRPFSLEDMEGDHPRVVVLTQRCWESRYNSDPNIVGRSMRMSGDPYTIIGVAPRVFDAIDRVTEFYLPYVGSTRVGNDQYRYNGSALLIARLKPGVTVAAAEAQLAALERRFYEQTAGPEVRALLDRERYVPRIFSARAEMAGPATTPLWLLQGAAAFVMLIGCVNVINLLLARANARRHEFAVRNALGAGAGPLLRTMLAESLVLTLLATLAGVAIATWSLRLFNRYLPQINRLVPDVHPEPSVLLIVAGGAVGIAALVGVLPFLSLWRSGLKLVEGRAASAPPAMRRLSNGLAVVQIAFALLLLVGAGLLIRSFARIVATDPGFDAVHVVQGRVTLPPRYYNDANANLGIQQQLLTGMRAIPGVELAAISADFGVGQTFRTGSFTLRNPGPTAGTRSTAFVNIASPDYFATMGMPLLEGRLYSDADDPRTQPVVVVDDLFVRRYFPGRSAVGEEMYVGSAPPEKGKPWLRIVGVVRRANLAGLEQKDGLPFVYYPMNQVPQASFSFLLRTRRAPGDVLSEMRRVVRAAEPTVPLWSTGTLQQGIDAMLAPRRVIMVLLGVFAGLALLLAAVGLYGVLAYDVSQRTREIGIRAALGATRRQLVGLIVKQGLRRTAIGLVVGLAGSFYVTRFLHGMLFEVTAIDPVAYLAVVTLLLLVALLASWLPARRAAKVDPLVALRSE